MVERIYTLSKNGQRRLAFEADGWQEVMKATNYFEIEGYGIQWISNGKTTTVTGDGQILFATPTTDLKKVIVVFPYTSKYYPPPGNAVVYTSEGDIYERLFVPELISKLGRDRTEFMTELNKYDVYFLSVAMRKVKHHLSICIDIGFLIDWMESRLYSPEENTFGNCVDSGRI
ncbi:hypothetical protein [Spirosoma utsteinense]|uniref:Uncharacterized protein n=1 Tax=Spirosoma utsteinense TaxID=2585773 RepID=A0ABR6WE05_9BACT|nr:hypothetical protein [Spirosoma utsteinense]MBC3788633.1 hypothetical protein [Spirosoma utsteinense]MBC3794766.1 hypothetical protein [Spirosoma utsteinense]